MFVLLTFHAFLSFVFAFPKYLGTFFGLSVLSVETEVLSRSVVIRKIIVYKILYNHISNAGAYLWTMKSTFNELFLLICSDSLKGGPVPQNTVCFTAVLHIKDVSSCLEVSTLPLMQSDRYACA